LRRLAVGVEETRVMQFRSTAFALTAALLASPAFAAEDAPVATADATSPSVSQQIDAYLRSSPAATLPTDTAPGVTAGTEDRKVHGMVEASVGSGGYRSLYLQSEMPIGKTGTLSVAIEQSEGRGYGGYGYGYGGYGYGGYGHGGYGRGSRQSIGIGLDFSNARDRDGDRCDDRDEARRYRLDPTFMDSDRRLACAPTAR
jgi:hypothetical protein